MQLGPVIPAGVTAPHLSIAGVALYAVLFAVVAVATFRRPVYGILALILIDPFAFYQSLGPTTLTLSKIGLAAVIAGLLLRKTSLQTLWSVPVIRILLALLFVTAAVAISELHAAFLLPAARETLKWAEYAIIFAACAIAFHEDPQ